MRIQIIKVALASLLLVPSQSGNLKPQVTPIFFEARVPAFLLECRNATGATIRPNRTGDMMRLDGKIQADNGSGHSGDEPPLIASGGSWKEVVVLHGSRSTTAANSGLGAIFMSDTTGLAAIAPGRHSIAFLCGGSWSDESSFILADAPKP